MAASLRDIFDIPKLTIKGLTPIQEQAFRFMLSARRCINAQTTGGGKTVCTLAAIDARSLYPAVILCKASIKLKMASEVLYWLDGERGPKRTVSVLEGRTNRDRPEVGTYVRDRGLVTVPVNDLSQEIIICNYEIAWDWAKELAALQPKVLVIDEAHHVCRKESRRHRAAEFLARSVAPVSLLQHIYELTASPMPNRPADLIGLLEILGRLAEFGGRKGFSRSYCDLKRDAIRFKNGGTRKV